MSLSAPTPPDPRQTANTQQQYNTLSAEQQQAMNMVGQNNPYGSLSYDVSGVDPVTGLPKYTASTQLNPWQQYLLNQQQATQAGAGGAGAGLLGDVAKFYSQPPNLDPSQITSNTLGMEQKYLDPWFKQQTSDLTAGLRNQGIAPGSEAYDRATQALQEAQSGTIAHTFAQIEPQAFQQAATAYQMPLATTGALAQALLGYASPTMPNWIQTPNAQMQPANYAGLAEENYKQQNANYQNMLSGLFSIPSAFAGGAGKALGTKYG